MIHHLCLDQSECKQPLPETKLSTKWCNSLTHTCYSKALYNSNNTLVEFSRGCASQADLTEAVGAVQAKTVCLPTSDNSNSCVQVCSNQLCNNATKVEEDKPMVVSAVNKVNCNALAIVLNAAVLSMYHKF